MDMDSEEEEMMMRMGGPRGRREREMMMREFGMHGMRGGHHGRSHKPSLPEGIHGRQLPCKLNTLADGKFHEQDKERSSSMIKWDVPYIRE
eukprot:CAMPEP_0176359094 /NCGR_PEP_ID=MMETSP0126-20121128/16056_1 /TAXON_ID=141414 ORGANISM="Strombidinopsis acuminatum, Strain SPMC142" /NCGR_SAMPLE_ID=MMETSP0126 /ASSEMBLY_ACC=CAM_ASM_000229 /LENGTH=90 /DNA_ID=CAMNT_0017713611 /DNA_START=2857 /DNA_END=3129 /DNA_ORIENTATION=-